MVEGEPTDAPDVRLALDIDFAGLAWTGRVELPAVAVPTDGHLDADGLRIVSARRGGAAVDFAARENGGGIAVAGSGPGSVVLDFAGDVETKNLFGFYRAQQGPSYVLTSHCEPTGARKIFPCVDRPDRKIRIHLTVRAPSELDVVSNTLPRSTRVVDGRKEWVFDPTPPMSTYLFYLGVGKFDHLEATSGSRVVRVLTPPGRREAGTWASQTGPKLLEAYERYYGIPYPLPKLDLIAIAEHAFGAMENWGAISFQEARLLYDAQSGTHSRRDIVETIAHEIAHQWFGNLVTLASWDDVWLNESFASLLETKITAEVHPELDPWTDFFLRTAGAAQALDLDSLRSTHPIRAHVESPEEFSQIFDAISYGKGVAVLAMLDRYLGEQKFRAGVQRYLEKFRYRNTRTEDLWAALETSSGEPAGAIAGPWIERAGFPVVTVRRVADGIELEQRRFAYLGSSDEEPWPIPMQAEIDGRPVRIQFRTRQLVVPCPPGATVHLNPGAVGFYRVLYRGDLWDRLLAALPGRPPADRWTVLRDLAAFLLSGDVSWATFLAASRALRATSDRLVIDSLNSTHVGLAVAFPEVRHLSVSAREYLAFETDRVSVDRRPGEPEGAGTVRESVCGQRARLDPDFARELAPRFDRWESLDADLHLPVALATVRAGSRDGFEKVERALRSEPRAIVGLRLARALAWSPDPSLVEHALELGSSGAMNRSFVYYVASEAAANPDGRDVTWRWLTRRLPVLTDMFRGSGYLPLVLASTIPYVGLGREAEVREFFRDRVPPDGSRGLAHGLEKLEVLARTGPRLASAAAD